jgi:hypothetical protein
MWLSGCPTFREDREMKTAELTGAALDWAVAKCEGLTQYYEPDEQCAFDDEGAAYEPSANWAQGGPIIERERLSLTPRDGYWEAYYHDNLFKEDGSDYFQKGTTPLIAAMRCYVASKLGDEVALPEGVMPC